MMKTSTDLLLTINQAAEVLGVTPTMLRDWEVTQVLRCDRTIGGHRRYRLADLLVFRELRKGETDDDAR